MIAWKFGECRHDAAFLKNALDFKRVRFNRRIDRILAQGFFIAKGKRNPVYFFGRFISLAEFQKSRVPKGSGTADDTFERVRRKGSVNSKESAEGVSREYGKAGGGNPPLNFR